MRPRAPSTSIDVGADDMILDIGPRSRSSTSSRCWRARKTLVWNGPFGAFEMEPFDNGTVEVAEAAAELHQGRQAGLGRGRRRHGRGAQCTPAWRTDFTYVSTAGGAFLEWLEGKALPGVEVLRIK